MPIFDPSLNRYIATKDDAVTGDGLTPNTPAVIKVGLDGSAINVSAASGEPASTPPATDLINASMLGLTKRRALIEAAPKTRVQIITSTSGVFPVTQQTLTANQRLVVVSLRIQNMSTVDATVVLRGANSNIESFHIAGSYGAGIDQIFNIDTYARWPNGENISVGVSSSSSLKITVRYYVEDITTGLPV